MPNQNLIVSDGKAPRFPVSIKGVVVMNRQVVLLRNERDEWELPGGKLEPGEDPIQCLEREIEEELSISAQATRILDSWLYRVAPNLDVLIVTYGCRATVLQQPRLSHEHKELGLFPLNQINDLNMPEGYKNSIREWLRHG